VKNRITAVKLAPAIGACILFILLGCLLIPYAGIQNDEALFAVPFYNSAKPEMTISIFKHLVPTMVMSYVGALKTWIYGILFIVWKPSVWSIRLPMVLAGALTIWLFFDLLNKLAGRRAAIAGAFLLATEPTYLITTTYDWGPTALQILLLTAALLSAASRRFVLASFLLGLGMWNKAIFSWALAGLGVALLATYPKEVWRGLRRWPLIAGATAAFVAGAFFLISYNVRKPMNTFKGNARVALANIAGKPQHVTLAANGSGLFGYISGEEWNDKPKGATAPLARWGGALRDRIGEHRKTLGPYAFGFALLLAPLWWRVRRAEAAPEFARPRTAILFSLVFLCVTWLLIAMTQDAGGAVHHTILLWPFPVLVVAVGFAWALRPGWLFWPAVGLLMGANLLVINQYNVQFARNGSSGVWSDAIFGLSEKLPTLGASHLYAIDWGMVNSLGLLNEGKLPMVVANDPLMSDTPSAAERETVERWLADADGLFVAHTEAYEEFKGVGKRLAKLAAEFGYTRELVATVADANGRPVFEVSRYRK